MVVLTNNKRDYLQILFVLKFRLKNMIFDWAVLQLAPIREAERKFKYSGYCNGFSIDFGSALISSNGLI